MREDQFDKICIVMEAIDTTLKLYKQDVYFAPAPYVLESWWYALNAVLTSSNLSEATSTLSESVPGAEELDDQKEA